MGTGWYDDELVRTAKGWRIKRRVCLLQGWTGKPYVPEPNREHQPDMKTNVLSHHCADGKIGFLNAIKAFNAKSLYASHRLVAAESFLRRDQPWTKSDVSIPRTGAGVPAHLEGVRLFKREM